MSSGDLLHSKRWKTFMNYVYNIAGAVVIIGALFKLMHWPFAGTFLTVGLCTEAFIFIISSFEPVHEQPAWEKVFPELSEDYIPGEGGSSVPRGVSHAGGGGGNVSVDMGGIFSKADIAPEVLDKVSKGLTDLGNTASSISDISSATLATNVYVDNLNSASESLTQLANVGDNANVSINDSLIKLAESCQKITNAVEKEADGIEANTQTYNVKMQDLYSNLEQLNNTYSNQLTALNSQFDNTKQFNENLSQVTSILASSLEEMKKYQALSLELNKNLTELNSVYGNVLGSMNYKK